MSLPPDVVATEQAAPGYRYDLLQVWDGTLPQVLWVLLNPSTASAETDDATTRKLRAYAREWGYGSMRIRNLYARRTKDPEMLVEVAKRSEQDALGAQRGMYAAAAQAQLVIAGWGANVKRIPNSARRIEFVLADIARAERVVHALHVTRGGYPGHPLYLPGNLRPVRYVP